MLRLFWFAQTENFQNIRDNWKGRVQNSQPKSLNGKCFYHLLFVGFLSYTRLLSTLSDAPSEFLKMEHVKSPSETPFCVFAYHLFKLWTNRFPRVNGNSETESCAGCFWLGFFPVLWVVCVLRRVCQRQTPKIFSIIFLLATKNLKNCLPLSCCCTGVSWKLANINCLNLKLAGLPNVFLMWQDAQSV